MENDFQMVLKEMQQGVKSEVRTSDGSVKFLPIMIGLHEGSKLKPFFLALVMDEFNKNNQGGVP